MAYGTPKGVNKAGYLLGVGSVRTWINRLDATALQRGFSKFAILTNTLPTTTTSARTADPSGRQGFYASGALAGKIYGNTYYGNTGTPVGRMVCLFDRDSMTLVRRTFSRESDGYFEFTGLPKNRTYFALVFDTNREQHFNNTPAKRAEAWDNLVPE